MIRDRRVVGSDIGRVRTDIRRVSSDVGRIRIDRSCIGSDVCTCLLYTSPSPRDS